jgi:hypothetical protein
MELSCSCYGDVIVQGQSISRFRRYLSWYSPTAPGVMSAAAELNTRLLSPHNEGSFFCGLTVMTPKPAIQAGIAW